MDDTLLSAAVWRASDEWQIDDDPVDLHLRVREKFSNILLASAVGLVLFAALSHTVFGAIAGPVAMGLLAVAAVVLAVWIKANVGRVKSVAGVRRRVAAVVVAHRGISAVIATEGRYLRVRPIAWPMWQVIARTGEITMIGPDAEGNAVVFVDGQPTPLPAKVVEAPEPTEAEPIARVSVNGAEDEVPQWYAARHARIQWIPFSAVFTVFVALVYDMQLASHLPVAFTWAYAVLAVILLLGPVFGARDQIRLSKLLSAGQWQAYPVTVETWKGSAQRPFADLTVKLGVPGGEYQLVVKHASVELVANISATGTLWMVGLPKGAKSAAVGVPGHPIVAPARFA